MQKLCDFIKKINVLQGNWYILWTDIAWGLQKKGMILENKVPPNLNLEKDDKNKNKLFNSKNE